MKVDFSAGINVYRKNASLGTSKNVRPSDTRSKTDTIEFSRGSTSLPDKTAGAVHSAVLRDLGISADAARLEELSRNIREGNYYIQTQDLVKSLLEG